MCDPQRASKKREQGQDKSFSESLEEELLLTIYKVSKWIDRYIDKVGGKARVKEGRSAKLRQALLSLLTINLTSSGFSSYLAGIYRKAAMAEGALHSPHDPKCYCTRDKLGLVLSCSTVSVAITPLARCHGDLC